MFRDLTPSNDLIGSPDAWFGRTPAHWTVLPARALFDESKLTGHETEPLLSVTIRRGVILQSDLLSDSSKKDSSNLDKSKYKLVEPGDIAYNKMRAWQGAVGRSQLRGIVSPAYVVMRPRQESGAFLEQLMRIPAFAKEAERLSYGITSDMWSLRPEHFKTIYFPIAPADEQAAIVKYLGHAHARIDRAIAAKRKLIALLEEQKQAIIHRAVTRGLDPSVPLKHSGIPWLGEVPAHWKVARVKSIASMRSGNSITVDSIEASGTYPVYGGNGQRGYANDFTHHGEFVLVGRQGALCGNVHVVSGLFWASEHAVVTTPVSETPIAWLAHLLRVMDLRQYSQAAAQPGLAVERILNLGVPLPPKHEQLEIAAESDQAGARAVRLQARVNREIELLREFRTRLTSDVVTGQVDVREVAATLPELNEDARSSADDVFGIDDDLNESVLEFADASE